MKGSKRTLQQTWVGDDIYVMRFIADLSVTGRGRQSEFPFRVRVTRSLCIGTALHWPPVQHALCLWSDVRWERPQLLLTTPQRTRVTPFSSLPWVPAADLWHPPSSSCYQSLFLFFVFLSLLLVGDHDSRLQQARIAPGHATCRWRHSGFLTSQQNSVATDI
ncbi:unnamed protein product [Pleuronectes platessa]|uniref:Uncharacterized protein n=1 Tax=Pleuronectes platessa TaxID=8262 RepID=A0A9N7YXJ3_PLEPL|nr:unnamed protein product [Pleuronectes platessa]